MPLILNVSSKSISTMKMKPISELSICGRKVSLIASKVESRKARKRWRMLSVFLRCSAVINLPNTIEKRPIVEYLQTKENYLKFLSDRIVELSHVTGEILSFLFAHFVCCIYSKVFSSRISKCYTIVILHIKLLTRREITYETIV